MKSRVTSGKSFIFSIVDGTSLAFKIMTCIFYVSACFGVIGIVGAFGFHDKFFHTIGGGLLIGFIICTVLLFIGRMQFEKFNITGNLIMDT